MNIKNLINPKSVKLGLKTAGHALRQNSPTILSGLAVGGLFITVVLAVKATPEATKKIEKKKEEKGSDLTPLETIEVAGPSYIKTIAMGTVTGVCIIGANTINSRRLAALAGLYSVTETALNEYKAAAKNDSGRTLLDEVQNKLYGDELKKNPVSKAVIIDTGKGSDLCYDAYCGNYFYSSVNAIHAAENIVNAAMINGEMYMSLNNFYEELGIPSNQAGYSVGFTVDHLVHVTISSQIADDGRPCIVMDYEEYPTAEYNKLY